MTVKERLHRLVDELPESELPAAVRLLEDLRAPHLSAATARTPQASLDVVRARLAERGITLRPASPDAELPEPLDLPDVDLSGAILEEREEALRRWD
jgi:hypothetical protein